MELQISQLNKSFKKISKKKHLGILYRKREQIAVKVLNNLNLTIADSEMYGLLGNNGAGKSTLMNCIGGIHIPDSGSIFLKSEEREINVIKTPKLAKKRIIFNFQDPKFDTRLSAKSNLDFHLRMYQIERETRKKLITEYLKKFNLYSKKDSKVYFLSGGQKKQLENIRGFITSKALQNEDILFLTDEPTAYCDVLAKNIIWNELEDICLHGTVLFSTNDLLEAEKLVKPKNGKVGFIRNGSIIFSGAIKEIQNQLSSKGNIRLITETQLDTNVYDNFRTYLLNQYETLSFNSIPDQCTITIGNIRQEQANDLISETMDFLQNERIYIDKLEKLKPTINDLFLQKEA